MKILYIIDHLRPEGTQKVLSQLITGLTARGHCQTVLCLNDSWDAALVDRLHRMGVRVRFVGKVALVSGIGFLATLRWMRRERFESVVTLLFNSDVFGRLLASIVGTPRIVSSLRARNVHYRPWQRWLVRRTMPWANQVVINSSAFRDFAISAEGVRPERIVVIPNGVAIEEYGSPLSPSLLRAELGLPPESRLVGSVGRLTWQKGFDLLLEATASLPGHDTHLMLIGAGEERKRLQAQAAALGIAARVHFAGYRRDVPRLLGALDLYVHPARFEGMPNALLEAMAAGCPIVASRVDGNRELIEDGVHGWLVSPEDASALAAAMQVALHDEAEAKRRGNAARQRATEQFSVAAMVEAWERVLCGA